MFLKRLREAIIIGGVRWRFPTCSPFFFFHRESAQFGLQIFSNLFRYCYILADRRVGISKPSGQDFQAHQYMASIKSANASLMNLRLTFMVGVISPSSS